jgi:hypothetical protein
MRDCYESYNGQGRYLLLFPSGFEFNEPLLVLAPALLRVMIVLAEELLVAHVTAADTLTAELEVVKDALLGNHHGAGWAMDLDLLTVVTYIISFGWIAQPGATTHLDLLGQVFRERS